MDILDIFTIIYDVLNNIQMMILSSLCVEIKENIISLACDIMLIIVIYELHNIYVLSMHIRSIFHTYIYPPVIISSRPNECVII